MTFLLEYLAIVQQQQDLIYTTSLKSVLSSKRSHRNKFLAKLGLYTARSILMMIVLMMLLTLEPAILAAGFGGRIAGYGLFTWWFEDGRKRRVEQKRVDLEYGKNNPITQETPINIQKYPDDLPTPK